MACLKLSRLSFRKRSGCKLVMIKVSVGRRGSRSDPNEGLGGFGNWLLSKVQENGPCVREDVAIGR